MSDVLRFREYADIKVEEGPDGSVVVFRCTLGISPKPLVLIPETLPVLALINGVRTREEIISQSVSQGAAAEQVEELLRLLAAEGFLAGAEFERMLKAFQSDFHSLERRQSSHAGLSYSAKPKQLERQLREYFEHVDEPQLPKGASTKVLISPHIDYMRGWKGYASVWPLFEAQCPDTLILIGTSHQFSRLMFHLSRKHFESPLGLLEADLEFIEELSSLYGEIRSYQDEFLHKNEHSLELQVPFLKLLQPKVKIVPILVGSFYRYLNSEDALQAAGEYRDFVAALAETISKFAKAGRSVGFVAGVDMAHVGKFFGDKESLTPEFLSWVEREDRKYLDAIAAADKTALFENIAVDQDKRKVCGFPTMYSILDVCERLHWDFDFKLFQYEQAVDLESQCAVSFAGASCFSRGTVS